MVPFSDYLSEPLKALSAKLSDLDSLIMPPVLALMSKEERKLLKETTELLRQSVVQGNRDRAVSLRSQLANVVVALRDDAKVRTVDNSNFLDVNKATYSKAVSSQDVTERKKILQEMRSRIPPMAKLWMDTHARLEREL